ncbi:MAG: hypothetical protein CMI54_04630 [Parcubacteria group bacterium]|nr:hypothetical protein [Parcubacteria group bacterium]
MAKTRTSITSERRKEMPSRGKSKKTLIMDALRKEALSGVSEGATNEEVETAWFSHLVKIAFNSEDKDSGLCLRLLTERGWSALKPSSECVRFEFDPSAEPHVQAGQVMDAVAQEIIPPDLGIAFVGGIKSMIEIEANTELKERIEKLEAMLNG